MLFKKNFYKGIFFLLVGHVSLHAMEDPRLAQAQKKGNCFEAFFNGLLSVTKAKPDDLHAFQQCVKKVKSDHVFFLHSFQGGKVFMGSVERFDDRELVILSSTSIPEKNGNGQSFSCWRNKQCKTTLCGFIDHDTNQLVTCDSGLFEGLAKLHKFGQ